VPANKKLVVVVGAGASSEFGLPVGQELTLAIAQILDIRFDRYAQIGGDALVTDALRVFDKDHRMGQLKAAAGLIRDAMHMAPSIDEFLDVHQANDDVTLCGKLAVVRAILNAEKKSNLYIDGQKKQLDYKRISPTWLKPFFQKLIERCTPDSLPERFAEVSFVIFNYDRCIEHFLHFALQRYHQVSDVLATEILAKTEFLHPYGVVGSLPWQHRANRVAFGGELNAEDLLSNATQIKTFTQSVDPSDSDILRIRENVANSDVALFLGFAYHKQNMELMASKATKGSLTRRTYGTAFGISDPELPDLRQELANLRRAPPELVFLTNKLRCAGVFSEYWRSLSFL